MPTFTVRMSQGEKQALEQQCLELGVSPSSYCRALLRDQFGLGLPVAPQDRPLLEAQIDGLRRIGVNLNQAVRAMNEGRVEYEQPLADALGQVIGAVMDAQRAILRQLEAPLRPFRAKFEP